MVHSAFRSSGDRPEDMDDWFRLLVSGRCGISPWILLKFVGGLRSPGQVWSLCCYHPIHLKDTKVLCTSIFRVLSSLAITHNRESPSSWREYVESMRQDNRPDGSVTACIVMEMQPVPQHRSTRIQEIYRRIPYYNTFIRKWFAAFYRQGSPPFDDTALLDFPSIKALGGMPSRTLDYLYHGSATCMALWITRIT